MVIIPRGFDLCRKTPRHSSGLGIPVVILVALAVPPLSLAQPAHSHLGDPEAGTSFLQRRCVGCHRLDGKGAKGGRELGGTAARGYTPARLVCTLWNHRAGKSPSFGRMSADRPHFTEADVRNLLAYALCRRYFEQPGDAHRGKRVFAAKRCVACHPLYGAIKSAGPPPASWTSLSDPVALASDVWNLPSAMRQSGLKETVQWPQITCRELTDLLVYLRNLPELRGRRLQFSAASAEAGARLYEAKGCAGCHAARVRPHGATARLTSTDFVTNIWNHRCGRVAQTATVSREEIRAIFSYLWSIGAFDEPASPQHGERLFRQIGCAGCHAEEQAPAAEPSAPRLRRGELSSAAAAAGLLNHGPGMKSYARFAGVERARLSPAQVADLIAFLSSAETTGL